MHTEYIFNQASYKDLQKRRSLFSLILGLCGLAGVIVFIILYPITDYNKYVIFLFIPSLAFALIGLGYLGIILFMMFKIKEVEVRFTYDFNKEFANVKTYNKKELTSDNQVYYNSIMKYKDTGKNFFLYLPNKKVLPLSSSDPNLEEIKKIIKIEDIPVKKI